LSGIVDNCFSQFNGCPATVSLAVTKSRLSIKPSKPDASGTNIPAKEQILATLMNLDTNFSRQDRLLCRETLDSDIAGALAYRTSIGDDIDVGPTR
jgi:hypothetical protein